MSSFMDRLKSTVSAAGKGAQRITRMAQLKLDLTQAESRLQDLHRALGKACVERFIERGEKSIGAGDSAVATILADIVRAKENILELETAMADTKES